MKEYDLIVIGSGSAMNIVDPMLRRNPGMRVAVIDKDEPGGICLTRGCIPSKILLYPAELVRLVEKARELGIEAEVKEIRFGEIMERMRSLIAKDIDSIRRGLTSSDSIDYFRDVAEFVAPYTLKVGGETIKSRQIFLCIGSRTIIPSVRGLEETGYLTSDGVLKLERLPKSVVVIGGGYIAAEFGHFLSSMGSKVTILGRNARFLPEEEPEISEAAKSELGSHMSILTGMEVREVEKAPSGLKRVTAFAKAGGKKVVEAEEILVASGRGPISDILRPEKGGIETDERGWIKVDEYLETSQPGVWAFGDADGKHLFKHVANYESEVVYHNAALKQRVKVDYHAVPHAIFTYPEVAGVGMKESEAVEKYGEDGVAIGYYGYADTAKGEAMAARGYFVKVVLQREPEKILGAHIFGPDASVLLQEIVDVMNTDSQSPEPIQRAMYTHPALNEVVQRAFYTTMSVREYHHHLSRLRDR